MNAQATFESARSIYSYNEFIERLIELHANNLTTGDLQDEGHLNLSKLAVSKMKRLVQNYRPSEAITNLLVPSKPMTWYVITEGWCKDSSHILPVLSKIAAAVDHIELQIILRDENPEIMDQFLTNGTRSIPKVICVDQETGVELNQWGPRPALIQAKVNALKATPDFSKRMLLSAIDKWYHEDQGHSIEEELIDKIIQCTQAA